MGELSVPQPQTVLATNDAGVIQEMVELLNYVGLPSSFNERLDDISAYFEAWTC